MKPEFWEESWRNQRTAFHEGRPNEMLVAHVGELGPAQRVLVPLCGKAEDLGFLAARGHTVIGIELVEMAARAFFTEHDVVPIEQPRGALRAFTAGAITILAGDVFAATPHDVGPVTALYDRAALVALPADMRARYATHIRSLLPAAARGLVVTFEYQQPLMDGPPFSVTTDEVRGRWADAAITELASTPWQHPRLTAAGGTAIARCLALRWG